MKRISLFLAMVGLVVGSGYAQPNQLNAQFFHQPYLLNPALAGMDQGWSFFLGYAHQLNEVQDAGHTQALTAAYRSGKTALAIAASQDRQGLIAQTRLMGTYAYHLPLDGDRQHLHFGLSLGMHRAQIDESDIRGQTGDPVVGAFNEQRNAMDGGAGVAYTDAHWTIQVAMPALSGKLNGERGDLPGTSTFMAGAGYRFNAGGAADGLTVEPRVYYRTLSGMPAVVDAGISLGLKNKFTLDGVYHSSDRFTGGISTTFTSQLSAVLLYSNGVNGINFSGECLELGLKYALGGRSSGRLNF